MGSHWNPSDFDPHAPEFIRDPYPTYARFRAEAPVCRVSPYDSYWVFRHADVVRVLGDQQVFAKNGPHPSPPAPPFDALGNFQQGLFAADPPAHTLMRGCMQPLFDRAIEGAGDLAAGLARELLLANRRGRRIELYQGFAAPLPPRVLFHVLGLPGAHWDGVQRWVDGYVAGHDITQTAGLQWLGATSAMALMTYFQAMMDGNPLCPAHGKMVQLMMSEGVSQGMSVQQVQGSLQNLAIAGYASTTYLLATGTYRLLQHPEQRMLLRQQPALMAGAIREMLRFDAPAQLVDRVAVEDVELGGVHLRPGDAVTAVIGSANHDETVFRQPEAFDIQRDSGAALSFGAGIHTCLGEPLVWLTAPAALGTLLDLFPDLALDGIVQWQTDPYLRSVVNLPLCLE